VDEARAPSTGGRSESYENQQDRRSLSPEKEIGGSASDPVID
jgi:hypothetical protein